MKYIVLDKQSPIIFPNSIKHSFFKAMEQTGSKITSAGFVVIHEDDQTKEIVAEVYGESQSLRLKSDPVKDSILIEVMFA